jgi:hypothetical protein
MGQKIHWPDEKGKKIYIVIVITWKEIVNLLPPTGMVVVQILWLPASLAPVILKCKTIDEENTTSGLELIALLRQSRFSAATSLA